MTLIVSAFVSFAWKPARHPAAQATFWVLAVLVHAGWWLIPNLARFTPVARWSAIAWLAAMLAAMVLIIPFALLTSLIRLTCASPKDRWLAAAFAACAGSSGVILAFTSTAAFVIRSEDIRIAGLPAALDGFRVANLGDVHVGQFIDVKDLRAGINAINGRQVDLLIVSGDLIDDVAQLEGTMQALEASSSPRKTVAVLGNHEEMGDLPAIRAAYRRHAEHITLLVNENTDITYNGATLHIVGVDFPMLPPSSHLQSQEEQDVAMKQRTDAAFSGVESGGTVIAIAHNPMFFPFLASNGAQLTLSSHTHGAQLRLFGQPIVHVYRYLQGIYRLHTAYLDVSAGLGHWLPVRFGVPREIVIDTLRRD